MKRFTIIFSILLVLGFAGTLGYVSMSEDFVEPGALMAVGEDPDAPVWGMTMDDLLDYLVEKGFLASADDVYALSGGIGTVGCGYDGAEFYWWDLDDLPEGSNEAAAYQNMLDGEPIDLWQQGTIYLTVTKNGPFALSCAYYTGDGKALLAAFEAFGQTAGGDDTSAPVWDMSMDDLLDYMEEKGFLDRAGMLPLAGGVATDAYVSDNVEYYWWDVDNLAEGSNEAASYQNILDGEPIDLYQQGQYFMPVTKNGPFAISYSYYTGDTEALLAAFEAFGRE